MIDRSLFPCTAMIDRSLFPYLPIIDCTVLEIFSTVVLQLARGTAVGIKTCIRDADEGSSL